MLADIVHGHIDLADALFLLAFILAVAAAALSVAKPPQARYYPVAGWVAVASLALAWLVL